nr:hypothetical protein GCM10020063_016310 [Dactylosporangium thailandense]
MRRPTILRRATGLAGLLAALGLAGSLAAAGATHAARRPEFLAVAAPARSGTTTAALLDDGSPPTQWRVWGMPAGPSTLTDA